MVMIVCPFSDEYLPCGKPDCHGCSLRAEAETKKAIENYERLKDYWANQSGGNE